MKLVSVYFINYYLLNYVSVTQVYEGINYIEADETENEFELEWNDEIDAQEEIYDTLDIDGELEQIQEDTIAIQISQEDYENEDYEHDVEDDKEGERGKDERESEDTSEEEEIENEAFELEIESSKFPRYSCACHKVNRAIVRAFKEHEKVIHDMRKLNTFITSTRRDSELAKAFRAKKCKLRLHNVTRWSSGYLVLETVKKAYERKVFEVVEPELRCPLSLDVINSYLSALKPCFLFTMGQQSNNSTIADVIPGLLRLFSDYKKKKLPNNAQKLAQKIVKFLKIKFEYELN
jgi:hypothetical protein